MQRLEVFDHIDREDHVEVPELDRFELICSQGQKLGMPAVCFQGRSDRIETLEAVSIRLNADIVSTLPGEKRRDRTRTSAHLEDPGGYCRLKGPEHVYRQPQLISDIGHYEGIPREPWRLERVTEEAINGGRAEVERLGDQGRCGSEAPRCRLIVSIGRHTLTGHRSRPMLIVRVPPTQGQSPARVTNFLEEPHFERTTSFRVRPLTDLAAGGPYTRFLRPQQPWPARTTSADARWWCRSSHQRPRWTVNPPCATR